MTISIQNQTSNTITIITASETTHLDKRTQTTLEKVDRSFIFQKEVFTAYSAEIKSSIKMWAHFNVYRIQTTLNADSFIVDEKGLTLPGSQDYLANWEFISEKVVALGPSRDQGGKHDALDHE